MALLHAATLSPSKVELVARLLADASWGPDVAGSDDVRLVGAYRFDDPAGEVGLEGHLALVGDDPTPWHVPLSYRADRLENADEHHVGETEHSVLGTRHVYDATGDPAYLACLTAVALTGVGQGVEMRQDEHGQWATRAPSVRLSGGGSPAAPAGEWTEVGSWSGHQVLGDRVVMRTADRELRLERRPRPTQRPDRSFDLTATWEGQDEPALLARVGLLSSGVDEQTGYEGW